MLYIPVPSTPACWASRDVGDWKNFLDQLTLIFNVVGAPEEHEVAHIRNQQAKRFLESMRDRVKVSRSSRRFQPSGR